MNYVLLKMRSERRSFCDVTDQQASHGSREAADSLDARLRTDFPSATTHREDVGCIYPLDRLYLVHQQRRQLLHLPGGEQGIQERN